MNGTTLEELLAMHCAPTFAGLKAASLISLDKRKFPHLDNLLAPYEPCFTCKGITYMILIEESAYRLVLFYRPDALARTLSHPQSKKILSCYGYHTDAGLSNLLDELKLRLATQAVFPHEIGLFLGYPPDDVAGFIIHKGRECRCTGYWKVYADEDKARQMFHRYTACTQEYCWKLQQNISLVDLLKAG